MLVMRRMSKGALKSKITNALKDTSELLSKKRFRLVTVVRRDTWEEITPTK